MRVLTKERGNPIVLVNFAGDPHASLRMTNTMDILHAVIISIVEGITEFLPVSSTGHQVLVAQLLGVPQTEFVKSFEIFIQLGAILAIVGMYFKKVLNNTKMWKPLLAAFIPTGIIGFAFYKVVKEVLLGNDFVTVTALFIGGLILIGVEMFVFKNKQHHILKMEDVTIKQGVIIGLAQSLSIIPGVSRAAATIVGAMCLGISRETAVEFSFLLAVPTMLAATGLDLVKSNHHFTGSEWGILAVGFVGAFITAWFTVKYFLQFVKTNTFIPFGIYRIVVAILFWLIVLR